MLHDFDRTLENLLIQEGRVNSQEIDIAFDQPTGEWAAQLGRPTINFWCFDMRENLQLRNRDMRHQFDQMDQRRRAGNGNPRLQADDWQKSANGVPSARLSLPPMRLDLTYLVTAWARKVEDEHRLLWRALSVFASIPAIEPEMGVGAVTEQPYTIPMKVAQAQEGMGSTVDLWGVLDNQMRLSFTIQATVALDLSIGFDVPLVLESYVAVGQSQDPSATQKRMDAPDMEHARRGEIVSGDGDDAEITQEAARRSRRITEINRGQPRQFPEEDE